MDHFNKDNINTNDKVSFSDLLFKVSEANKFPFTKDNPDDDTLEDGYTAAAKQDKPRTVTEVTIAAPQAATSAGRVKRVALEEKLALGQQADKKLQGIVLQKRKHVLPSSSCNGNTTRRVRAQGVIVSSRNEFHIIQYCLQ